MDYRLLGRTGVWVSPLCLGAMNFGDRTEAADAVRITHAALDDLAQALEGGLDKSRPRPFYREIRGRRLREQL